MKRLLQTLAVSAALVAPAAYAQDEPVADPNTGKVSLEGGIDWTTAYYFRGYLQEDDDLILQPYATASFELCEAASVYVGTWNSVHSAETGAAAGTTSTWYESDLIAGVDVGLTDSLTLGVIYSAYMSPNNAFDTVEELGAALSLDDAGMWGNADFALSPYVGVYYETDDDNGTEDTYAEVGIAPTIYSDEASGLSVGVPVALGMSLDDYYLDSDGDDELLGYVAVALSVSLPLPIPDEYGDWALTGQLQYLSLLADSAEAVNNGDSDEFIASVGISFAY